MKKALVILLTLVVAGGLFAQTFTWNGAFEGGIGLRTKGDDDMVFGAVAPTNWVNGTRGQLQLSYANADGNAGARLRLRAQGNETAALVVTNPLVHQAWAWVKPFGDIIEFRGGRIHDDQLATLDPILGTYLLNSNGIVAYVRPTSMFTLGLGGYSGVGIHPGATFKEGGLGLWAGLGVNLPGMANIRAQFTFEDTAASEEMVINAIAGVQITALSFLPINLVFRAWDLTNSDAMRIAFHGFFGLNLVDNLAINLGGAFSTNAAKDDPYLAAGGWLTYTMGNVVPRLDLWYVSGGAYAYGYVNNVNTSYGFNATGSNIDYGAMTYVADQSYFSIRPAVQFRASATTWWEIGAAINMDLGDVTAVDLVGGTGTSVGFFTAVRVNF